MSIISGNLKQGKDVKRAHDYVNAIVSRALTQPSKRDLREMLAEAARNTAALQEGDRA